MSRTVFIQAYFNTFHSFVDELMKAFPEDTLLPTQKMSLSLLQRTNPMLLIKSVHETILPYQKMIEDRNTDFFLKHSYSDETSADSSLEPLIQKIKEMWTELTPTNHRVIWDYITNLLLLGKRCVD